MDYNFGDLYPDISRGLTDITSLSANPDKDDQEALAEDSKVSDKADFRNPRNGMVFLAIGLIVALVVFLGVE